MSTTPHDPIKMRQALDAARRAIGTHFVPDHCYGTGPMTGSAVHDLVECPACTFIAMYDEIVAALSAPSQAAPLNGPVCMIELAEPMRISAPVSPSSPLTEDLLKELDWCIAEGNVGPRSHKLLCNLRAALTTKEAPAAPVSDEREAFEAGDNKYRKKSVVIEATQWFKMGDHPAVIMKSDPDRYADPGIPWVPTLEGGHIVTPGDWIITGVKGEHYPCKPDIFAQTYEPARQLSAPPAMHDKTSINEITLDYSNSATAQAMSEQEIDEIAYSIESGPGHHRRFAESLLARALSRPAIPEGELKPLSEMFKLDLTDMHTKLIERIDHWMLKAIALQKEVASLKEAK